MEITGRDTVETVIVIEDEARYAEGYVLRDHKRSVGLCLENGEESFTVTYNIEEAQALHEALGHLIWAANHRED